MADGALRRRLLRASEGDVDALPVTASLDWDEAPAVAQLEASMAAEAAVEAAVDIPKLLVRCCCACGLMLPHWKRGRHVLWTVNVLLQTAGITYVLATLNDPTCASNLQWLFNVGTILASLLPLVLLMMVRLHVFRPRRALAALARLPMLLSPAAGEMAAVVGSERAFDDDGSAGDGGAAAGESDDEDAAAAGACSAQRPARRELRRGLRRMAAGALIIFVIGRVLDSVEVASDNSECSPLGARVTGVLVALPINITALNNYASFCALVVHVSNVLLVQTRRLLADIEEGRLRMSVARARVAALREAVAAVNAAFSLPIALVVAQTLLLVVLYAALNSYLQHVVANAVDVVALCLVAFYPVLLLATLYRMGSVSTLASQLAPAIAAQERLPRGGRSVMLIALQTMPIELQMSGIRVSAPRVVSILILAGNAALLTRKLLFGPLGCLKGDAGDRLCANLCTLRN
eukprot:PLAT12689.1.p1 GENE.PLAT12689.1~~PLAT12689.1.p1  ORF type:complete len:463 (+),score=181.33 PLAT12689.1:37-1425(+)